MSAEQREGSEAQPKKRDLQVLNRDALATVIRWIEEPSRRAKWEKAKHCTPVGRTTRHYLKRGKLGTISQATYENILAMIAVSGVPAEEWVPIAHLTEDAVLGPDAYVLEQVYDRWHQERAGRFLHRRGPRYMLADDEIRPLMDDEAATMLPVLNESQRAIARGERVMMFGDPQLPAIAELRLEDYHQLLDHLTHEKCLGPLRRFRDTYLAKGYAWGRVHMSLIRILEPLLEAPESGFVEMHWRELDRVQLRDFIDWGIKREELLLTRAPDPKRIQEIVERGPHTIDS